MNNPELLIYVGLLFLLIYIFGVLPQEKREEEARQERIKRSNEERKKREEERIRKQEEKKNDPVFKLVVSLYDKERNNNLSKSEENILSTYKEMSKIESVLGRMQMDGVENHFRVIDEENAIVTTKKEDFFYTERILQRELEEIKSKFNVLVDEYMKSN